MQDIGQVMETMKEFGLKTSIKGIPRALRSQSTSMRVLWSVSVVSFLGMACYQSYLLMTEYLSYDITTVFSEYRVDLAGYTEQSVQLPYISICNTNPFGSSSSTVADIPTLKEFYERVLNVTSCSTCSSKESEPLKQVQELFLTPEAYAEYIGLDHIKMVGHSLQSMLVDCQLIVMEGRVLKHIPCFPGTKVIDHYDVKYYNCYTLQLPTPLSGHLYFGLAIVLHLDNFSQNRLNYLDKTNIRNRMAGIQLSIHAPNTPLEVDFESVFLPPGFMGDVRVDIERRKRKPEPYGDCKIHMDNLPDNMTYTSDYCYASCIQSHVTSSCGCLDQNPYTDNVNKNNKNTTKCLNMDRGYEDLIEKWDCVIGERYAAMLPCNLQCTSPCVELTYNTQVGWL